MNNEHRQPRAFSPGEGAKSIMRDKYFDADELSRSVKLWEEAYRHFQAHPLNLDLTRGKPCLEQLELSQALDGILDGNYLSASGEDARNYGGSLGLPEARSLFGELFERPMAECMAAGNSSLQLVYFAVLFARDYGYGAHSPPWSQGGKIRALCPSPGYDRHFKICEHLGVEMVPVPMLSSGPDMEFVEHAVEHDPAIKAIFCVPRFSNPTGVVYSDETVRRLAVVAKRAAADFLIFWDNAYALHAFDEQAPKLLSLRECCEAEGVPDAYMEFSSTSKITFAGGGICCLLASERRLNAFAKHYAKTAICSDRVNQLRHVRFLRDAQGVQALMRKHAKIIAPKFRMVQKAFAEGFSSEPDRLSWARWSEPQGGYFISFDTMPGLASKVVEMAANLGVKLTPAGVTFPYGCDAQNSNIRIAPTCLSAEQLKQAMEVFVLCVSMATAQHSLSAAAA